MKIGFIGCGNMGSAILDGLLKSKNFSSEEIFVSTKTKEKLDFLKNNYKVNIVNNNEDIAKNCKVIILAVKPNVITSVISEINYLIEDDHIIISLSVANTIKSLENILKGVKIARVMPNLAVKVLSGVSLVAFSNNFLDFEKELVKKIFSSVGVVKEIDEKIFNTGSAISGSSPAFFSLFLESFVDGAVYNGMKKEDANFILLNAMLGSAKYLLETKLDPQSLRGDVSSPAGTTIEGIKHLEEKNIRNTLIDTITKCVEKAEKMK